MIPVIVKLCEPPPGRAWGLEDNYSIFREFIGLLPKDPLLIITIFEHNADGTSTVELPNGCLIKACGQSVSLDSQAFVQFGQIQGEAPELSVEVIEI